MDLHPKNVSVLTHSQFPGRAKVRHGRLLGSAQAGPGAHGEERVEERPGFRGLGRPGQVRKRVKGAPEGKNIKGGTQQK